MEKVKVTQKEFDWLERYELKQEQIDFYINMHRFEKRPDSPIADWETSKVARALYRGYEIEPEFKINDWVVDETNGQIRVISYFHSIGKSMEVRFCEGGKAWINDIRHATPQEIATEKTRRWWAKHDRDVWEVRKDDAIFNEHLKEVYIVEKVNGDTILFDSGDHDYLTKAFKSSYKIFCFAQDRKDI